LLKFNKRLNFVTESILAHSFVKIPRLGDNEWPFRSLSQTSKGRGIPLPKNWPSSYYLFNAERKAEKR